VPVLVLLALSVPKATELPVALAQLEEVIPDVPVQKVMDSLTLALRLIAADVLTATTPVSSGVVQAVSE